MTFKSSIAILFSSLAFLCSESQTTLDYGRFAITLTPENNIAISQDGANLIKDGYFEATYRLGGTAEERVIKSNVAPQSVNIYDMEDELGQCKVMAITYTDGTANLIQTYAVYPDQPYFVTKSTLTPVDANSTIESNRFVVLATNSDIEPMCSANVKMVTVPFDNDGHGRYCVFDLNCPVTSYEVGYAFDANTGRGFVAGSIDHDKWKSGIEMTGSDNNRLSAMNLISGYTSASTRDYDFKQNSLIPHGYVKGQEVASARFFVGMFDDWRNGMNTFAESCAAVTPPAPWELGNPMGWSSWGVMMNHVNYDAVVETAQWIKDNLVPLGFHDQLGQEVISLDSYAEGWGLSNAECSELGKICQETYRKNGKLQEGLNMRLGLYGGMVVWDWNFDSQVEGTGVDGEPSYTWGDALLRYNGQPHWLWDGSSYCAIDPTHPAFRKNIETTLSRWSTYYKIKYVKFDFINAGICEGDSWYDPEITTGVMAYNYGMKIIYDLCEKYDMYIVESMSPLFPYQWAHGRRSCCDRFSELEESEYVMNAMTWGWWTDRLYTVNDPDQLVLFRDGHNMEETPGINRVRATSGMCTGAFIIGDSFSDKCVYTDDNGHTKGDVVAYPEEAKVRALEIFGNEDINQYVRDNTGSFYPIDYKNYTSSQQTANQFFRETDDYYYVAVFNWSRNRDISSTILFADLGIDSNEIGDIKELWTGESVDKKRAYFEYSVPKADVRVYRIDKNNAGIETVMADKKDGKSLSVSIDTDACTVQSNSAISSVRVFNIDSTQVVSQTDIHSSEVTLPLHGRQGVLIIDACFEDGEHVAKKAVSL